MSAPKNPITQRQIHVYTCLTDPSRKPVAMIDNWPMVFRGATPMQARKVADDWRREAVRIDKLLTNEQKAEMLGEAG